MKNLWRDTVKTVRFTLLFSILAMAFTGCTDGDSATNSNDNETDNGSQIDPTPGATLPPTSSGYVEETLFAGFESGWGHFLDGGEFSSLSIEKAYAGTQSARLEGSHPSSSSMILHQPLNIYRAESLSVSFWVFGEALADGDALLLDYSDGTEWVNVLRYEKGRDFGNGLFSEVNVSLSKADFNFSRVARLRLVASTIGNPIYVDDISITASTLASEYEPGEEVELGEGYDFDHSNVTNGCAGCHDNQFAFGKSASHIETSDVCEFCHVANSPQGWETLTYFNGFFDHSGINSDCLSCHNAILAVGKGPFHIDSSNACEQCHLPSSGWQLTGDGGAFLHAGITSGCVDCHNNEITSGKHDAHIVSSDSCENCHASTQSWLEVDAFDHAGIVDNCVSCHNGVSAEGKGEFHIPSTDACEQCHSPANGWLLSEGETFDHQNITTGCIACHNGDIVSGKTSNHIPSSDNCESCHEIGGQWNQVTGFDHQGVSGNCVSCHNNTVSQGKGEFHIASGDDCESCHIPNRGWLVEIGSSFSHSGLVDGCVNCHNNTVVEGKSSNHIASNDRCESCHAPGISWQIEAFAHAGITGECATCHNGVVATGKSVGHIPSPDVCESCHAPNNNWQFAAGLAFSHAGLNSECSICHDGANAVGKGVNHIASNNECEVCHNAGGDWSDAKFSHVGITAGCVACHDGTGATGKSANHIASSDLCETCHLPEDDWNVQVVAGFDHLNINTDCGVCHNGLVAQGKSAAHVPSDNNCENCHNPVGSWSDAVFNHDGITQGCSACHNGGIATGKSENHFVTTEDCSVCHQPSGWSQASFVHPSDSAYPGDHSAPLTCTSCHLSNQQAVIWPFSDYEESCAGCHANDYEPGEHRNASVDALRNCAGACHRATPAHSVLDLGF